MMGDRGLTFYGKGLAEIHGQHHESWLRPAFPWLLEICGQAMTGASGLLVDLGCGQGQWLAHVKEQGLECLGLDRSEAFARAAAGRGLPVLVGNARSLPVKSANVFTAFGEVLSYLAAGEEALRPLENLLSLSEAVRPGGRILADLMVREDLMVLPGAREQRGLDSTGRDWHLKTVVRLYDNDRRLVREIEAVTADGTIKERHVQGLIDTGEALEILREHGLDVQTSNHWGPVRLMPGRKAFLVRRRG
ncbi:MAG: methyltransferase domain-containing protein [Magnetovibrionaceae bacterium]